VEILVSLLTELPIAVASILGGTVAGDGSGTKNGGSIYIEGGGALYPTGTITAGKIEIGTGASSLNNSTTSAVNIGRAGITTKITGTVQLPTVGTSGFVKLGANGQLSADTNSYALASAIPTVSDGTLTTAATTAGATNTHVVLELSGTFSANTSTNRTIKAIVGPALTALASTMTGAGTGFIRKNGADTYSIDTNTYLTGNQSITLTGDVTGTGATSIATTLATVNSNVGTFNNVTVNAKGLVTSASNVVYLTGTKVDSISATSPIVASASTGAVTLSHANSGVGAGTYNNVTVNATGHVTSASNAAYLTSSLGSTVLNWSPLTGPLASGTNYTSNILKYNSFAAGADGSAGESFTIASFNSTSSIAAIKVGHTYGIGRIEFGNMAFNSSNLYSGIQSYGNGTYPIIMRGAASSGSSAILEVTSGDIRAPIFYEYNNTAWFADLADTGTSINVAGGISGRQNFTVYGNGGSATVLYLYGTNNERALSITPGSTGNSYADFNIAPDTSGNLLGYRFYVNNTLKFTFDVNGNLTATGNITAYSDVRLKTNVQTIENSLDKTLKLRGVSYERDGKKNIGVIAQEIREILPEVVYENDDEQKTLSVSYGNVVGLLIEAIKELNAKVEDLQNQLANK
jgi:Chaperone of endosialidase